MSTTTKRTISPAHAQALQDALKASGRGGANGVAIGRARALEALQWVYAWGWSAPAILESLAQTNRQGLVARLVRQGLLKQHRTPTGGGVRDVPIFMCTLTDLGESEVVRNMTELDDLLPYSPRVAWPQMRHDFWVQKLTLQAKQDEHMLMRSFTSDSMMRAKAAKGKIHDAIWVDEYAIRTLIEVELTPKKNRELDTFVLGCLQSLLNDEDAHLRIYSDSPALLKLYSGRFTPLAKLNTWKRDNSKHWLIDNTYEVPERIHNRISYHNIT